MRTRIALAVTLTLTASCQGESPTEQYARMVSAVQQGDVRAIERTLAAGFDPDFAPEGESSLLYTAIYAGDHAAVRALLERGADVTRQEGFYRGTAIMFAADSGDVEIVDLLLEHGADINGRDGSYGDVAINWASYAGHLAMVEHLLSKGADPTIFGHGDALDIAMRRGFEPIVELLAEHMGETRTVSPSEALLLSAIKDRDVDRLGEALAAGASADAEDRYRRPILALAARTGRVEMLETLIAAGADVDAPDPIGYTALMEAAREGHVTCVRLLLEHGADPNHVSDASGLALTPLHLGAIGGSVAVVEALMDKGAAPDVKGTIGTTPLLWGLFEGSLEAGIRLVELGADPTLETTSGYSAEDFAADNGNEDLARALAEWRVRHASARFRVTGDGHDQLLEYVDADALVLCTRDAGFADLWIRLGADAVDNGETGPHLDIDVCNLGAGGTFRSRDARSPRCGSDRAWGVWWHANAGSVFVNDAEAPDCELSLALAGDLLSGSFRCGRLIEQESGREISVRDGEFRCRIR